jgi:hypothetical protein
MACLDTSFLIDLAGGGGKLRCARAATKLRHLAARGESLTTTRFNVAELYVGVYRTDALIVPDVQAPSGGRMRYSPTDAGTMKVSA